MDGRGSVVRVGRPIGGSIPTLATQKIGDLTAGGVAVHLLPTTEVPLSKAQYPHAPQAL